ncbi:LytR/AlgR family response regulator transcription factor [Roseivirga sp.]|uniref:LytR/AlgR family response regulator transcription factor n=1 Tax=Roseivirga sp. TaxID=1964215 RepID=UPI003B8BD13C
MRVLIVEDEQGGAQNLCDLLLSLNKEIEVLAIVESVRETIDWVASNPKPDLGFFDIRLADGDSFEIFEQTEIHFPIIFTSAYDEYALKAFKVNSVDYLVKPIEKKALAAALDKYAIFYANKTSTYSQLLSTINELRRTETKQYKKSLLVYYRDQIIPLLLSDIAYFQLENEMVYCVTHNDQRYQIDQTLEKISNQIDPQEFFRANRQFIISRTSVQSASQHFNRKLKIKLSPIPNEELIISKSKAIPFKTWLES